MLTTPVGLKRAAAEIAKVMPESSKGEHEAQLSTLVGDDPSEAKRAALRMLAYQVSNNLVVDDEDDLDDDKYKRIVQMFRDIGLPSETWVSNFSRVDQSTRAFAENLFEAAVNCIDLDIMEALLDSGVDPNQPVMTNVNCALERPIQVTADSRVRDADMTRLLLRHGADVDLTTEDRPFPALHIAAEDGAVEIVQILAENGADIYTRCATEYRELVETQTALVCAANSKAYRESRWEDWRRRGRASEEQEERPSTQIFKYLLNLHQRRGSPARNRTIYRDALVIAARRGRPDFVILLQAAGANVSARTTGGVSPMEAAAAAWRPVATASALLELGAQPSPPRPYGRRQQPSALHIAAANDEPHLVRLLIDRGALVNDYITISSWDDADLLASEYSGRTSRGALRHLHTPLQMALHSQAGPESWRPRNTGESAIVLLSAGAELFGGELARAALIGNEDLIRALLQHGADCNDKDPKGNTALKNAISAGRGGTAFILLHAGAKLAGGEVFAAFHGGNAELVRILLERGADLNSTGPGGETVLEAACSSGCFSLLKELTSKHGKLCYDSGALCAAVFLGPKAEPGLIDELLELRSHGVRNPILEATALSIAAYSGQESLFERLLHCDHPVRSHCLLPMEDEYDSYKNVMRYPYPLEKAYEKPGFWNRPNMIRCSPLAPALHHWESGFVERMLKAGYRPDPLSLLVALGRKSPPPLIRQLISHGANPNALFRHNLDTPLQFAVRLKRAAAVRLLLGRGADVNALPAVLVPWLDDPDNEGWPPRTALQAAVETGNMELVKALLKRGADVNGAISLDFGASALQLAAMGGFLGIAKRLLELGAHLDAERAEINGRTALEGAAEMGRLDMVHFLLEQGAQITGRGTWQYLRAVKFARRNGHHAVARLLERRRAWSEADREKSTHPDLLDEDFTLDRRPAGVSIQRVNPPAPPRLDSEDGSEEGYSDEYDSEEYDSEVYDSEEDDSEEDEPEEDGSEEDGAGEDDSEEDYDT